MTFHYFLSQVGLVKNIRLNIQDFSTGTDYDFHIPIRIKNEEWDSQKQRPSNIYIKKFKKINVLLDRIKVVVSSYILKKKAEGKPVSHKSISRQIAKICIEKKNVLPEGSLLSYITKYIEQRSEIICHSTYKRYKVFYKLIQRFEGFIHKPLMIEEINADFVKDFFVFGRDEEYSESTINRTIHFVKTILNFAERKGIRTFLREIEIRMEKGHKEIVTLTEEEISQIEHTEVPEELQTSKEWLLISCFTGQRFSDFIHFSTEQMVFVKDKKCLKFTQQKTKKEIVLPLHPIVSKIIERNGYRFPKPVCMRVYNDNIRTVAKLAGIDSILKTRKRIGHRVKNVMVEKWMVISSHIGRRSFATNFYGKIPTSLLIEATGHSTEHMFLNYINPVNQNRVISLSNYFEEIYNRELMVC